MCVVNVGREREKHKDNQHANVKSGNSNLISCKVYLTFLMKPINIKVLIVFFFWELEILPQKFYFTKLVLTFTQDITPLLLTPPKYLREFEDDAIIIESVCGHTWWLPCEEEYNIHESL